MGYEDLEILKVEEMMLLDAKVESKIKPYFFIKTNNEKIKKIGGNPEVKTKAIVFETDSNNIILVIMFKFNEDDELIYGQWCNYYSNYQRKRLDRLIYSDKLFFSIVDSNNKKQATFECSNSLRFIIKQCSEDTKGQLWNNKMFIEYVESISKNYNNRMELFNRKLE